MKIQFRAFILAALFSIGMSSCTKKNLSESDAPITPGQKDSRLSIGFSIDTLAIERWRRDCDVFLNTAKEAGANVIVQNAGNSVEEQEKQINYLVSCGIKALVVVPRAATIAVSLAKGKSVEEAASANGSIDNGAGEIPVVWLHPTAVTAENMDEIVIQSGFHTREEIYRKQSDTDF